MLFACRSSSLFNKFLDLVTYLDFECLSLRPDTFKLGSLVLFRFSLCAPPTWPIFREPTHPPR
jgi:hypothetical protein